MFRKSVESLFFRPSRRVEFIRTIMETKSGTACSTSTECDGQVSTFGVNCIAEHKIAILFLKDLFNTVV